MVEMKARSFRRPMDRLLRESPALRRATLIWCLRQLPNSVGVSDDELFETGMDLLLKGLIEILYDPTDETYWVAPANCLEVIAYHEGSVH